MSHKKRLISNFLSLTSIQVVNYILPLITIPYLVRVLGPERFGLIAFAQAFIQYFVLITDYGFNLSVTRKISINRDNRYELNKIVSSVFISRVILLVISFLLLAGICLFVPGFKDEAFLYIITFGFVLGNAFTPLWLFQGMEKMRDIAVLNIIGKSIFTIFIFVLVRKESDYLMVAGLNSIAQIIVALLALYASLGVYRIKFLLPSKKDVIAEFKDGWHIFISTIAISLYTTSNTFILGLFTSNTIVGYYSAAEKIAKAFQGPVSSFSQTVYPHISRLALESKETVLAFIRKIVKVVGLPTFLLSLVLLIFAPQISNIILGRQFKESIPVIQILSFLPFIVGLSNIFGIQVMLNFGLKKIFTKIIMMASLVNIILALILVTPLQHIGISISVLITEIFVTSYMFVYLQRNGLKVLQFKLRLGAIR